MNSNILFAIAVLVSDDKDRDSILPGVLYVDCHGLIKLDISGEKVAARKEMLEAPTGAFFELPRRIEEVSIQLQKFLNRNNFNTPGYAENNISNYLYNLIKSEQECFCS